ncbi:MliC family protein [Sphingopyxis sp.]|uniref:MliC family protein n=1 Tax=Sphingopyxis sp. TaxID=1908224 RepID=UPI003D11119E
MKMIVTLAAAGAALALAGCTSMPPRNTGTSYDCNGGTKLKVDYVGNGAIVRINGRRTVTLRQTPSNRGPVYENRSGMRLERNGNDVTWNTSARSASESCRVVYTPL